MLTDAKFMQRQNTIKTSVHDLVIQYQEDKQQKRLAKSQSMDMFDMLSDEDEDQYSNQQNTDESVHLGTEGLVKKLEVYK